jgi:glutaminyl-peptide cyclotransferase
LDEAFNKRKEEGVDLNSTIQLIFFDGEEAMVHWTNDDSIYGARHLAKTWTNTLHTLTNLNNGSTFKKSPIEMIDALVLLDLLGKFETYFKGTKEASISNSQQATQWVWDRLCRIHEKLAALKLLSPYMLERLKNGDYYFRPGNPTISSYALQDDHVPFLNLGVPICHIIPTPFPNVWHKETDNADALDEGTIMDLALTFRVLVSEYFGLQQYI